MTVVNLNLLTSVSIKKDSLPHCCQPKFSMPTATPPPHAVDAPQIEASSGTADIGTCKRRPVEVPLNSEVKHLAALVMKKKACLDKKSYKPLMSTVTRMVSCHSWNLHVVMIQLLLTVGVVQAEVKTRVRLRLLLRQSKSLRLTRQSWVSFLRVFYTVQY